MIVTAALFVVFVFLLLVLVWGLQTWKCRRIRRMIGHLPGPPTYPIVGSAFEFLGNKDMLQTALTMPEEFPSPFRFYMGSISYVVSTDPADIQTVCNSSKALSKPSAYNTLKPILRNGIVTASGAIWKKHRRMMMPTFNQKILNSFVAVFTKQAELLVGQLKAEVGAGTFDVLRYLCPFSIDTICATTMGVHVNAQAQEASLLHCVNIAVEIACKRMLHIWLASDFLFSFTSEAKLQKKAVEESQHFIDKVIQQKRDHLNRNANCGDEEYRDLSDDRKFLTTLDVLLDVFSTDSQFTDEELRDEALTIVLAGSDTTAVTLGFILVTLALHPEHQEKVYEEVIDVLGTDGTLHHEDLKKLEYTERVIKEAMRIFPPVPMIGRDIEEDIKLPTFTMPKGSSFIAHLFCLHRNPEIYPDPLKFDPDRFLPEEVSKRHPYAWMPFVTGPRNCIGFNYALMQVKTTTAYLVRKYKFETEYTSIESVTVKGALLTKPERGHLVSITQRR